MDYSGLSKEVSYALRHAPWEYELELDPEGWVEIDQLLHALCMDNQWGAVGESDLAAMIEASDKKRHQIEGGKIRALYGHSVPDKISKIPECPPATIYHGTARALLEEIVKTGLQPMGRQYVHLSADKETAMTVGKRKDSKPVLLGVYAEKAWKKGMKFYRGNNTIWLADYVSPQYIFVINPV
ncbi:RNA 2'-phosphotransferase [Paenibacillus oenotherae]|uniref:Probable RNA 2'-phosphotransferase n=1 Tax=Paenibacillus oenotherae TaxID=1435645 RepID=A0ABS7D7Y0_9BACL|nr:RNA 2'-phosphotransferase [Paenibacillus oenotherae]MBW7475980.1 RNA 2'-phosphotransferase [Paenibacillus oenotherae]